MVKFNPKTFKKKLNTIWSLIVRERDGKCMMCGKKKPEVVLHAHHCVVQSSKSLNTRWETDNGITLCYHCHIPVLHEEGTAPNMRKFLKVLDAHLPMQRQEELIDMSKNYVHGQQEKLRRSYGAVRKRIPPLDKLT